MSGTGVAAEPEAAPFLKSMALVDALREYARGGRRTARLDELGQDAASKLDGSAAQATAGQWLRLFGDPLAALDRFRDSYLSQANVTPKQLAEAREAAATATEALRRRLERLS